MRILALFFLFAALGMRAYGQAGVVTSTVTYTSGHDTVSGYFALPAGKGPFPGIVMVHEWWGLTDWIKENARMFAGKGYAVLAVDLYRGGVAKDAEAAHELMRGLPEDRAARDLVAAVQYLRTRPEVEKEKIGSIGWCMGGGYSLETALHVPDLSACVVCYGRLVTDTSRVKTIPCPILGIFGADDLGIPPKDVNAFASLAKEVGKSVDVKIYSGAGHAFMNPTNPKAYRKESSADAWSRIEKFFKKTLQ